METIKERKEMFCKGKEFMDCIFVNRNWDCKNDLCPLSKNKTRDVQKHIERIIKEVKLQTLKDVLELIDEIYEDEWTPRSVELIFDKTNWERFKKELKQKIQGK